jgi:hypothetical protein
LRLRGKKTEERFLCRVLRQESALQIAREQQKISGTIRSCRYAERAP